MLKRWLQFIFYTTIVLVMANCAKEQTDQQRQGEQTRREKQRLDKANFSTKGMIVIADNQVIPFELSNQTLDKPEDNKQDPIIETKLKLGFFGGTNLTTTKTSFNFATKNFSAVFDGQQGNQIELSAKISKQKPTSGLIKSKGKAYRLDFDESLDTAAIMGDERSALALSDGGGIHVAVINFENLQQLIDAPRGFHVPEVASLKADIKHLGTAIVSNPATVVYYAPLLGQLEIHFQNDSSKLLLQNISIANGISLTERPLEMAAIKGAAVTKSFTAVYKPGHLELADNFYETTPSQYVGIYKTSRDDVEFHAVLELEYLGSIGTNPANYIFSYFPRLKAMLYICEKESNFLLRRQVFILNSLDHLSRQAKFTNEKLTSSENRFLSAVHTEDWQQIAARFITADDNQNSFEPQFIVNAVAEPKRKGCAAVNDEGSM